MKSHAITHSRENRMPVQIAEISAKGYIQPQLRKSGSTMMEGKDLAASHSMRSFSKQRDEFSPKERPTGRTSREWQRMVSGEHSYHRRGITNE